MNPLCPCSEHLGAMSTVSEHSSSHRRVSKNGGAVLTNDAICLRQLLGDMSHKFVRERGMTTVRIERYSDC